MRDRRLRLALAVALCALAGPISAQEPVFRDLTLATLQSLPPRGGAWEVPLPARFRALEVDVKALESLLDQAPAERSAAAEAAPLFLALPYPDGTDRLFRIEESPILEPELAARFPEIRTFVAQGVDDPTATARLSLTSLGFHAMVLSTAGTVFVNPYRRWDARYVLSYFKGDARPAGEPFRCGVREESLGHGSDGALDLRLDPRVIAAASGSQLRTYRLALAGTGEYTAAVCAPNPAAVACGLAAMAVSMNRVNGIYEREVAIRMVLIANNNLVVYTNGASDPYSNGNGVTMLSQNQSNLNSVIGSANYDIGHVFSTGGGGVANLSVPCTSSKARGVTGQSNPVGDGFDVDYVAHEMGHQFGGDHTFNGTTGNCGGGNRSASSAYEPGSGTTIMAYAGICGAENLQPHSDDTFHTRSFDQIVAFSTGGTGSSCAAITATGNSAAHGQRRRRLHDPAADAVHPHRLCQRPERRRPDLHVGGIRPRQRRAAQHRHQRGAADLPLVRAADRAEPDLPAPVGHPRQRRDPRRVDVEPQPHHDLPPDRPRQPGGRRRRQLRLDDGAGWSPRPGRSPSPSPTRR